MLHPYWNPRRAILLVLVLSAAAALGACDWDWDDVSGIGDGEVVLRAENDSTEALLMGDRSLVRVEPDESARVLRFEDEDETRRFVVERSGGVRILEIEAYVRRLPSNGTCTSTIRIIKRPGERFFTTDHDERCTVEIVSVRQF
jgi:hypothetical protein